MVHRVPAVFRGDLGCDSAITDSNDHGTKSLCSPINRTGTPSLVPTTCTYTCRDETLVGYDGRVGHGVGRHRVRVVLGRLGTPHPHHGEKDSGGENHGVVKMLNVGAEGLGGAKGCWRRRIPRSQLAIIVDDHRISGCLVPQSSLLDGVNPHPTVVCRSTVRRFCARSVRIHKLFVPS